MKSIILGLAIMVAASLVGWLALGPLAMTSGEAYVSQSNSVRLD